MVKAFTIYGYENFEDSSDPGHHVTPAMMSCGNDVGAKETVEKLILETFLFTGHDGQLGSKAQDPEAHGSGFFRFRSHQPEELRVSWLKPDVAVSSLRAKLSVEVAGTMIEGTFRYTRVWAIEADGLWRVVAGHVSEVQSP